MPITFEYAEHAQAFRAGPLRPAFELDVRNNPTWTDPDTGEQLTWDHCLVLNGPHVSLSAFEGHVSALLSNQELRTRTGVVRYSLHWFSAGRWDIHDIPRTDQDRNTASYVRRGSRSKMTAEDRRRKKANYRRNKHARKPDSYPYRKKDDPEDDGEPGIGISGMAPPSTKARGFSKSSAQSHGGGAHVGTGAGYRSKVANHGVSREHRRGPVCEQRDQVVVRSSGRLETESKVANGSYEAAAVRQPPRNSSCKSGAGKTSWWS